MSKYRFITLFFLFANVGILFSQTDSLKESIVINYKEMDTSLLNFQSHDFENKNSAQIEEPAFLDQPNLTGSWWGLRNRMFETGIQFDFCYKGEGFSNLSGGIERGTKFLDNYDVQFNLDLEKILNMSNAELYVYILGNSGRSIDEMVGTSQGITNIEAFSTWKLYQILFKKSFFDNALNFAFGLYDYNSEFDTREYSGIFINPSHGVGPDVSSSGLNGPSIFPTTSLGLRIKYETEDFYLQTAILDGVPGDPENSFGTQILLNKEDGLLLAGEIGIHESVGEQLNYKIALGAWGYTSQIESNRFIITPDGNYSELENNYGVYLTSEKNLTELSSSGTNVAIFFRIGFANPNVNPVDFYCGSGIKFRGLINGREEDELGLALAFAHNSESFRQVVFNQEDMELKSHEINLEGTYSIKIYPWLTVQPDLQYFINPSFCNLSENSFLFGTRIIINF